MPCTPKHVVVDAKSFLKFLYLNLALQLLPHNDNSEFGFGGLVLRMPRQSFPHAGLALCTVRYCTWLH